MIAVVLIKINLGVINHAFRIIGDGEVIIFKILVKLLPVVSWNVVEHVLESLAVLDKFV